MNEQRHAWLQERVKQACRQALLQSPYTESTTGKQDQGQPVHSQIYRRVSSHILDELHAAIKVCVNAQHQRSICNRLNQLSHGDLVCWEEDNGRDPRSGTVGRQCG